MKGLINADPPSDDIDSVTKEIIQLRNDLTNATKSLISSMNTSEELRTKLKGMALEKQNLFINVHENQQCNQRLANQLYNERDDFQLRLDQIQQQINLIRKELIETKKEFSIVNGALRRNLKITMKTSIRLSNMYLRMRTARHKAEEKWKFFENLCYKFSDTINEQSAIIKKNICQCKRNGEIVNKTESNLIQSVKPKIKHLIDENISLRMMIMNEKKNKKSIVYGIRSNKYLRLKTKKYNSSKHTNGKNLIKIPKYLTKIMLSDSEVTIFDTMKKE